LVNFSGGSASSGLLDPGPYSLNAGVTAAAGGSENGFLTGAASAIATVYLAFAELDSPYLVHGVLTAGGIGRPGLLVEALDGANVIDSARTGDDGSYLLSAVTTAVTLRFSDPAGGFQTIETSLMTPPATFDVNLDPAVSVPALDPTLLGVLAFALAGAGWATRRVG
jgi:hypothetical protein